MVIWTQTGAERGRWTHSCLLQKTRGIW